MSVRPSPIAGMWYPGQADQLRQTVQRYLNQVDVEEINGRVLGLLVPHAGYRYSGQVAAHAFHYTNGLSPELVVVLSPYHRTHHAALLTSGHESYATPLGNVIVDVDARQQLNTYLQNKLGFGLLPIQNDGEHAIEIELPFLQTILSEFNLLPIMIREQTASVAKAVGEGLAELAVNKRILIVASSDLSHFFDQTEALLFDKELLRRVESFDPDGVISAESEGMGFACGRGAISAMLWAAKLLGSDSIRIVHQATSGDVTNDYSSVVGYGAAVVWASA
ncbi:MAG: AmmeMemoRadiSam system protein B [Chloroflexi bacterium]|nr:AmmeMemoRadiSam system protein B [Chloroflexota bacterium]